MAYFLTSKNEIRHHPGWRVGDTPENSRLLTDDELVDHKFGKIIIDEPPPFNPNTQRLVTLPVEQWQQTARTVVKGYVVEPVPVADTTALDQETLNAMLSQEGSAFRAVTELQFEEANRVRGWLNKPQLTRQQFLTALLNKMRTDR